MHSSTSHQVLIDDLVTSVDREREELRLAKEKLDAEIRQFEIEKERVNQVLQDNEQVRPWEGGQGALWFQMRPRRGDRGWP